MKTASNIAPRFRVLICDSSLLWISLGLPITNSLAVSIEDLMLSPVAVLATEITRLLNSVCWDICKTNGVWEKDNLLLWISVHILWRLVQAVCSSRFHCHTWNITLRQPIELYRIWTWSRLWLLQSAHTQRWKKACCYILKQGRIDVCWNHVDHYTPLQWSTEVFASSQVFLYQVEDPVQAMMTWWDLYPIIYADDTAFLELCLPAETLIVYYLAT